MFRTLNLYRFCLRIVCGLLPLIAFAAAGFLRFTWFRGFATYEYNPSDYLHLLLLATVIWAVAAEYYGLTSVEKLLASNGGAYGVLSASTVTYMVLFSAVFFYHSLSFSRVFIAISGLILVLLTLAMREIFRHMVARPGLKHRATRVLIIGADRFSRRAAATLARTPLPRCQILGFVRLPGQYGTGADDDVYELTDIVNIPAVEDIVIALPPEKWFEIPKIMASLGRIAVPVRAIIDLGRDLMIRDKIFHLGRMDIVDLGNSPVDDVNYLLFKRAFDMVFALLTVVVTAPLMLLIAIAIRLGSPGPVLFVQERVGLNGRLFRMYKFRTMRLADGKEADTRWTTANDPRCTRFGRLLRRTSLDELPQFFNVLKGDMSVVGPRPERPHFVGTFLERFAKYNSRHRLKVGITGWAQINGLRGNTPISKRLRYDLYYIQNWSFAFDLRIIALTVRDGIFGKNAY